MKNTNITEWFDPHDLQHMKAYAILVDSGEWPEGFITDKTTFPNNWQIYLAYKLADAWMEHMCALQMR